MKTKINLKYLPSLNSFTTEKVEDRHLVQAVNRQLYPKDFWKSGSGYIHKDSIDEFVKEGLKTHTIILPR